MTDTHPDPDWWHDPVLLALDFSPVVECDALNASCAIAAHPAAWRCALTCGCTLLLCDEILWSVAPCLLDITDYPCPRCGMLAACSVSSSPVDEASDYLPLHR